jgi:dihydroorotase
MVVLDRPVDMHLHLREGELLKQVIGWSVEQFAGAVVMPNLVPPVDNRERLEEYRREIEEEVERLRLPFKPLMTLFMRRYTEEELRELKPLIFSIKLYPQGVTTNSEGGVAGIEEVYPVLEIMEELGIPLSVHGETNGFVLEREREFIPVYRELARRFPKLKIIMEHISTAHAVGILDDFPNLYATITLHHLLLTLDDVVGGKLNPHLFCKPIVKTPADREALQLVVKQAHPKVMFGSDSAPHPLEAKLKGAAGIFSAPLILPALAQFFEGDWEGLQKFVSDNARANFDLDLPYRQVTLIEEEWRVPYLVGDVVPMWAGKKLRYRVV